MALLSSLLPRILPHLSKASEILTGQQLEDTVIDFFERTRCFQSELAAQDIVVDQAAYTITPPASHVLIEVHEVRVNERWITPTSIDALDLHWSELSAGYTFHMYHSHAFGGLEQSNWRYAKAANPRFYYIQPTDGKLRLVAIPDTAYTTTFGLIVKAAWKPIIGVTTIDDAIFNDYYGALVHGTLGRMYAIPEKAWSNAKLAVFHAEKYEEMAGAAEAAVVRNQQRNNLQVYHSVSYSR